MAKHEDHELRIIKVTGSSPPRQVRKPAPVRQPRTRPTPAEALDRLKSMKGANALIERIPALGNPIDWNEVAFWGVNIASGAALESGGPFFWHCDFLGFWNVQFADDNGYVMFWGQELVFDPYAPGGEVIPPPGPLTGQIWCDLQVPVAGLYMFVAQVQANGDPPDYTAYIEWGIGDAGGQIELFASGPYSQVFVVELPVGFHRFTISQVKGIFFFRSMTAWRISPPSGAMGLV